MPRWRNLVAPALALAGALAAAPRPDAAASAAAAAVPPSRATELGTGAEALTPFAPEEIRLQGFLGRRVDANVRGRLLPADENALLAGFRKRPGGQAWVGEHVGKWLDAAARAYRNTHDPALRAKIRRVAAGLVATQEQDGYLGTYLPAQRFGLGEGSDWDVWVHRYGLLGLAAAARATGDRGSLEAAERGARLLIATFQPGRKNLLAAGTHGGLAATSVLETMVLLHRISSDPGYLAFAEQVRSTLDEPGGPELIRNLNARRPVSQIADGKAYELLANLVGLCELAREARDPGLLEPVQRAWEDIAARRLYLTGTTSAGEHFRADHELPNNNAACVGETCVTATWVELNAQLLRLTGRARYAEQLERAVYNHLLAAQRPDGARWCVYTPLQGWKPYSAELTCCLSSGSRALTFLPELAYLRYRDRNGDGLCVNFFERSQLSTRLGGQPVHIEQATAYPASGWARLNMHMPSPARFAVRLRVPPWAEGCEFRLRAAWQKPASTESGWLEVPSRDWREGDSVEIRFGLRPRFIRDPAANPGRVAAMVGPLVLALDERSLASQRLSPLDLRGAEVVGAALTRSAPGSLRFDTALRAGQPLPGRPAAPVRAAALMPVCDVGSDGSLFQVWLRAPGSPLPRNPSLLASGHESRSRLGGGWGEIIDGDESTFAGTFNGRSAVEDWFAVSLRAPATVRQIVFMHGQSGPMGGWFDASSGKPRVQVVRRWEGRWEDVGVLNSYPATTGSEPAGLRPGQAFAVRMERPIPALAVRVVGRPAGGHVPNQNSATCAELQAFAE